MAGHKLHARLLAGGLVAAGMLHMIAVNPSTSQPIKPTIPTADRHQPGKVFLEHADELILDEKTSGGEYQVLKGNVQFRKDNMFMFCDSAYFYDKTNSIDAFSNVRMEQGDTLFVYGDELNYNGQDEFATLYGLPGLPVRLINRDVKLVTDVFYYDLRQNYGYYDVGGVLTDKQNRLESIRGEYYPDTKNADFYDNVELRSLNKDDTLRMYTNVLNYNTATHIARISEPTRIVNRDGYIVTTSGTYNTNNGVGDLYKRSTVYTNRGNTLTADTLIYDRQAGIGEGFGAVILTDSVRESSLHGNYGYYDEVADSAFVTGRALAKQYRGGGPDTLYLHGDTINAYMLKPDSTRVTNVFHRVRFYRRDLQGICDSLSMTDVDSIMRMYYGPVVWSEDKQIFGNLIEVHISDSIADRANLPDFGMMAQHIAEDCFDQLSGNRMTAWFNDSTITRLYVEGNVQTIVFPMENDSTYNKYAFTESSFMDAYFKDNAVDSIRMWPETTGHVAPLFLAKRGSYFLPKFKWLEKFRPASAEDVFNWVTDTEGLLAPISTGQKAPSPQQPDEPQGKTAILSKSAKGKSLQGVGSLRNTDPTTEPSASPAIPSDEADTEAETTAITTELTDTSDSSSDNE